MQNIRSESSTSRALERVQIARRRAAVLLVAVLAVATGAGVTNLVTVPTSAEVHIVRQGETLWELARTYSPSADPRSYVHEVRELNHLASPTVFPGQALVLPH